MTSQVTCAQPHHIIFSVKLLFAEYVNCPPSMVLHEVGMFLCYYCDVLHLFVLFWLYYQFEFNIFKVVSFQHINCICNLLQITQIYKCLLFFIDSFILIFSCNVLCCCKRTGKTVWSFLQKLNENEREHYFVSSDISSFE